MLPPLSCVEAGSIHIHSVFELLNLLLFILNVDFALFSYNQAPIGRLVLLKVFPSAVNVLAPL